MLIVDSFGSTTSGTIGYAGPDFTPAYYFAPLELPDGATLLNLCLDAKDTHPVYDLTVSIGRITLSTGLVTEVASAFTSGDNNSIQHACSGIPGGEPPIDNNSYVYFLRARMQSNGAANHWLLAARVQYSVTSLLP